MRRVCAIVVAAALAMSSAWGAPKKATPQTPLTEAGKKLEARYSQFLDELRAEIVKALPQIDEQRKAAYLEAREAEKAAEAAVNAAQKDLNKLATAQALVAHAKGKWIGGAEKGIADAKEKLKKATTEAEREAARKELAKWQANKEEGLKALKERQAALEEAKRQEPKWRKALEEAKQALEQAKARTLQAVKELGLEPFLSSDKLDAKLVKFVVILEATPRGLAEFAQQSKANETLVEKLLADTALMKQMLVADGARDGKYGEAMRIYTDIQKASRRAKDGVLQRLALAVALEHAVPIAQRNPKAKTDAPPTVDPVKRYLHYEKAYLAGELDPAFKNLTTWDLRFVVNGYEPDETLAWGRQMLRNYRPDHIITPDYRWRYVGLVRTDIRYGSQYNKFDKPELQFFQNILMNGGVCGRRAFFGRFILRAFGIPTTARPQRGHAALVHWTPDGWVVCLGAAWGFGWTRTRYKKDLDFLANTQARENPEAFLQVKRAQWIGDVVGEKRVFGFHSGDPGFWYGVSLYLQRKIIEQAKAKTLAAVGEELGEANESKVKYPFHAAPVTEKDRKIAIDDDGVITIPAVACSKPTKSTGKIIFMPCILGGKQLHYSRLGNPQEFEYTFDAPRAGKYALTVHLVSPSWGQHLLVRVNGSEKPVDIPVPLTVGMWRWTKPVEITLAKGRNVLTFSTASTENVVRGLTIKEFRLKPVN